LRSNFSHISYAHTSIIRHIELR